MTAKSEVESVGTGKHASAATSNCTGRGHLKMYRPERSDYCRNLATLASSPSDFVP